MTLDIQVRRLATASTTLIQDLSLVVPAGHIHTVMGASGSGKSSLLGAISATLPEGITFEGHVQLQGRTVDHLPTEQRRIGVLFQDDLLFAHMTVHENLLFAVPATSPAAKREDRVRQGLEEIEMLAFADRDPATLSGGQRARVALMRALLAEPQALLLDEPFTKLDADLRERMRKLVFDLVRKRQIPALLVTHDAGDVPDPSRVTHLGAHRV